MIQTIKEKLDDIQKDRTPFDYKRTKFGIIPYDWEISQLRDLIKSLEAGVSVNSEDTPCSTKGKGILKTSSVSNGKFIPSENKIIIDIEINRAKLNPRKGSIVISRMNTPELVGEIGYVDNDYPNLYLPDRLWQADLEGSVDGKWLTEVLSLERIKHQIKSIATGTSNSMKNISKSSFLSITVPKPSYYEQRRIATILSTWDKAIELKEKLIDEKKKQETGLMQKLLTGKVRLPGFKGEWKGVKLGKILEDKTEKTTENDQYQILSCTKDGVVSQSDHFNKQIASTNNIGYKILRKGEVVLSPMNLWLGGIDISTFDVGIVSPAYKVYEVDYSIIGENYLRNLLRSDYMIAKYDSISQKGASVVRRNLSIKDFESLLIRLPTDFNEMNAIDKLIGIASKEIALLEAELANIKLQKKGLMQLLLTGIVRVNTQES